MQQCKFCSSTLPNYAHFCACCGHLVDDLNQGATDISSPPELDGPTLKAITPPLLSEPWHPIVINSAMGQGDVDATIRLQRFGEGNMLDNRHFEERHNEENRAVLPGMMLLAAQMGEGQAPVGNVPVVQGTPQVSGVPAVQGTPAMPANPPGAQALYYNAPASAPAAPPAPSWVPHTLPETPPAHHPRHQASGELLTHHHHRPRRRHVPRPHGIAQHLLIAAVAVIIIATSAVTGALAIFRPALSLRVNGGITPGGTFQLHGVNFTPGSSVTLSLDQGVPLSSIGHGDLGEASHGAGFANVLQMSISAGRSLQATAPSASFPVSIQGTFDVTIQVGQNWSAGVHTIHATDRMLGRTADLQFAIPAAQAKLVVTPSSALDFGSLEIGRKVALPVIVGNTGGRQLHWTAGVGSTPWLQVQTASGTMLPGDHEQVINIVANASNLAAKDYSAVLHINSDAGEARIVVKLKVIPPGSSAKAILDVNPASLDFGTQAVGAQVTMNVTLANTGTQALSWGADTGNANWLKLSSSSGKILPGGLPQIMNVTADTTQLAAGNHSAMLNIKSNGGNKQIAITVVVTGATPTPTPTPTVTTPITSPAVLAVNPPGLDFGSMDPNTAKTLPEIVKNTGGQSLNWNIDPNSLPGWLSVDTGSGTVQPGNQQPINVTVNTSNPSPGPYSATLNFTSNGGNASIPVSVTVNAPPKIGVSPNPLDFGSVTYGNTATLQESVSNSGGQSLNWNLDPNSLPGWLSVDTSSGTVQPGNQQPINVTANTSNLSPGSYTATLNFTSNGGNVSVTVTITVVPPIG
jgi:Viral BACON domain/Flagellar-associated PapD-like